jgi:hypothetical protein
VVLMEHGKAVATGTHAELMEREPRYAAVLAHAGDPRVQAGAQAQKPAPGPRERIRELMTGGAGPAGVPGGFAGDGSIGGFGP